MVLDARKSNFGSANYDILLQNETDIITKCDCYFITKCDKTLLRNAAVVRKGDDFITTCDISIMQ